MPTGTITPTATAAFPVASAPVFCGDIPDYVSYSANAVMTLDLHHREGGGFTVSDPVTGIFGTGDTPFDAMQDIVAALREQQEVLAAQAELSPALQAQLDYLRQLI
jgi:hypothetical protein